jgi:hypothetical protein
MHRKSLPGLSCLSGDKKLFPHFGEASTASPVTAPAAKWTTMPDVVVVSLL